jgi:hypothetical protein
LADEAFSELAKKGLLINGLARDERSGDGCFAADEVEVKASTASSSRTRGPDTSSSCK